MLCSLVFGVDGDYRIYFRKYLHLWGLFGLCSALVANAFNTSFLLLVKYIEAYWFEIYKSSLRRNPDPSGQYMRIIVSMVGIILFGSSRRKMGNGDRQYALEGVRPAFPLNNQIERFI